MHQNTHPEKIIDKNGVLTTRHKKDEQTKANGRLNVPNAPSTNRPYITYTPADVDAELSRIYEGVSRAQASIDAASGSIDGYESRIEKIKETFSNALARAIERGDGQDELEYWSNPESSSDAKRYRAEIDKLSEIIDQAHDQLGALEEEAAPYEAEFIARGGWSRFYQVTNSNGHVHKSMQCSTCYPTTTYYWHHQLSGATESELIDQAGSNACTVCFPDAPVEKLSRPGVLETPDMADKRKAREERERKAAEKKSVAEAKGIAMPDGSPLRDNLNLVIKTERTAEITLVDNCVNEFYIDRSQYDMNEDYYEKSRRVAKNIYEALKHKRGLSDEELFSFIKEKGIAKIKREKGDTSYFEQTFTLDYLK